MSSKKSGYCVFDDTKLIDFGCWELNDNIEGDWRKRIKWMYENLDLLLSKYEINIIYCEDVPPSIENSQTVKILSALQGCVFTMCNFHNIDIIFVPVSKWKNIVGIDLTHSKEFKKILKENKNMSLTKFKGLVKAYEKKLSVENINNLFGTDFIWKSPTSKFNQDDITDSINIVVSNIMKDRCVYSLKTKEELLKEIFNNCKSDTQKQCIGKVPNIT